MHQKIFSNFQWKIVACFLGSILFTFFHAKVANANFFSTNHTTLLVGFFFFTLQEIQCISFTQLISMVTIFFYFANHFHLLIFFISNRKKIKVFWLLRLFSHSFFRELNRSGSTFLSLLAGIVSKVSQNKNQWVVKKNMKSC